MSERRLLSTGASSSRTYTLENEGIAREVGDEEHLQQYKILTRFPRRINMSFVTAPSQDETNNVKSSLYLVYTVLCRNTNRLKCD